MTNDFFDSISTYCFTSSTWLKIWKPIHTIVFCQSSVSSKVFMGVVNTFETCMVLDIKITSWPIHIECGVKSTLIDMNSKYSNLLSNIVNGGLTCSSCFLLNLSIPSIGWLTIMVTKISIVKVWPSKDMILKLFHLLMD